MWSFVLCFPASLDQLCFVQVSRSAEPMFNFQPQESNIAKRAGRRRCHMQDGLCARERLTDDHNTATHSVVDRSVRTSLWASSRTSGSTFIQIFGPRRLLSQYSITVRRILSATIAVCQILSRPALGRCLLPSRSPYRRKISTY